MNFPSSIRTLDPAVVREAAVRALGEDRGPADITSLAVVPQGRLGAARVLTRENCILAGLPIALEVFGETDSALRVHSKAKDGDSLLPGDIVLEVIGPVRGILTAERTVLNFLQQLSGVATQTRSFVEAVSGFPVKILDTRKTVPGLRALQKYAVCCGGGFNHRMGLYDQFLLKDNHLEVIDHSADWAAAIHSARALNPDAKIEVEADTLDQVRKIIELGVDIIMLDNMSLEEMREAVAIIADRAQIEASGNMTLERVKAVAATGVDFISIGSLTHSVQAIDMSLEMISYSPSLSTTPLPKQR